MPRAKSESETRERWPDLTEEQFRVCRLGGTEPPFSGEYYDCREPGVYHCVCCDAPLFEASDKYDSGTGWPSFVRPLTADGVLSRSDRTLGMERTEVLCGRCEAHLGHVFPDGPKESTGLRYCINSVALRRKNP